MMLGHIRQLHSTKQDWASKSTFTKNVNRDALTEKSIVLITGGAGFIGSQLALQLHYTYNVSKVILMDTLEANKLHIPNSDKRTLYNDVEKARAEDALALFDFKRKRLFHILYTLGPKAKWIRADLRVPLPEFKDNYHFPILNKVFDDYPRISHVVHLAQESKVSGYVKDDSPRLEPNLMYSLLQHMVAVKKERGPSFVPHFTYASTIPPKEGPWFHNGLDEAMAREYDKKQNLYTVGVRLSQVYGPWDYGSKMYDLSERCVIQTDCNSLMASENDATESVDFIFIDDAIDSIMSAMQFRPQSIKSNEANREEKFPSVIFDVQSGEESTYFDVMKMMIKSLNGGGRFNEEETHHSNLDAIPLIERNASAKVDIHSRFAAQVSLQEGIPNMLSWHIHQAFPYGNRGMNNEVGESRLAAKENMQSVSSRCSPYDSACMRGKKPFHCASECSGGGGSGCVSTKYDDVIQVTKAITESCSYVIYTIDFSKHLSQEIRDGGQHLRQSAINSDHCHIAFVSHESHLIQNIKAKRSQYQPVRIREANVKSGMFMHGCWTLIPIYGASEENAKQDFMALMLPKYSPMSFFSSNTKYAIYHDPDIHISNVSSLLHTMQVQSFRDSKNAFPVMVIADGKSRVKKPRSISQNRFNVENPRIDMAYNSIRTALQGSLIGGGVEPLIDSSWVVHSVQSKDAHLLRCDIYDEIFASNAVHDVRAIEFIIGMHNFWTEALAKWHDETLWWKTSADVENQGYWTGVVSSAKERSFVGIIPSQDVGVSVLSD